MTVFLRHNLIELVSASKQETPVSSFEGKLYSYTKGVGFFYKIAYLLIDNFLDIDSEQENLVQALRKTEECYLETTLKVKHYANNFPLIARYRNGGQDSEFCTQSVTLASFHLAVANPSIRAGINEIYRTTLGHTFPWKDEKEDKVDFVRRVIQFEAFTREPMPFEEIRSCLKEEYPLNAYEKIFTDYLTRIFTHPIPLDTDESILYRRERIQRKFCKIMRDLGKYMESKSTHTTPASFWCLYGFEILTDYLPYKRPDVFVFKEGIFHPASKIVWNKKREWIEVDLKESENLSVILFQNFFKASFYLTLRQFKPMIPLQEVTSVNEKEGYWLLRKVRLKLSPLNHVMQEIITLFTWLKDQALLPIDAFMDCIDKENFGFSEQGEMVHLVPYTTKQYHPYYLQCFLWSITNSVFDYLFIFDKAKLGDSLMAKEVAEAFRLNMEGRSVREIALKTKTVEKDFEKFWIKPFQPLAHWVKINPSEKTRLIQFYNGKFRGSYLFPGFLKPFFEKR